MQKISISKIKPNKENPRKIDPLQLEKLKKSIQEFPEMLDLRPVVINKDNVVLGGNMRLKALQELGYKEVPFLYAENLTPEQEREFIIKDNVGFGEWDYEVLQSEWSEEPLSEWGLDLLNFESETEPIETVGDDSVPDAPKTPFVVRGDIFEIKANGVKIRVGCLDSTNANDTEKLINNEKIDMFFSDPPYEIDIDYSIISLFCENTHIFIFNNDRAIIRQLKVSPFEFKKFFVFNHSGTAIPQEGGNEVFLDHILISHEIIGAPIVRYNKGNGTRTVIKGEYRRNELHKHAKPMSLLEPIIEGYTNEKQNILDVYCGSGSTAIACLKTKRNCFTNDISENYVQIAVKRLIDFCKTNNFEYTITLNDLEFDVNRLYE